MAEIEFINTPTREVIDAVASVVAERYPQLTPPVRAALIDRVSRAVCEPRSPGIPTQFHERIQKIVPHLQKLETARPELFRDKRQPT